MHHATRLTAADLAALRIDPDGSGVEAIRP
jgi:hypothetical protein